VDGATGVRPVARHPSSPQQRKLSSNRDKHLSFQVWCGSTAAPFGCLPTSSAYILRIPVVPGTGSHLLASAGPRR